MKKWLVLLMILPTICSASVNPSINTPWEAFYGPWDSWTSGRTFSRMPVPHGWLVFESVKSNLIFVADENHQWILDASLTTPLAKPE